MRAGRPQVEDLRDLVLMSDQLLTALSKTFAQGKVQVRASPVPGACVKIPDREPAAAGCAGGISARSAGRRG